MKIPISGKIPRSYGSPPLEKGAIEGFLGVGPDPLRLISCAVLCESYHELLCAIHGGPIQLIDTINVL